MLGSKNMLGFKVAIYNQAPSSKKHIPDNTDLSV